MRYPRATGGAFFALALLLGACAKHTFTHNYNSSKRFQGGIYFYEERTTEKGKQEYLLFFHLQNPGDMVALVPNWDTEDGGVSFLLSGKRIIFGLAADGKVNVNGRILDLAQGQFIDVMMKPDQSFVVTQDTYRNFMARKIFAEPIMQNYQTSP
jgi:hypothetical protein